MFGSSSPTERGTFQPCPGDRLQLDLALLEYCSYEVHDSQGSPRSHRENTHLATYSVLRYVGCF